MFHGSRTRLIRDYRGEKRKGGICSDECSNRKHKIAADLTLTPPQHYHSFISHACRVVHDAHKPKTALSLLIHRPV